MSLPFSQPHPLFTGLRDSTTLPEDIHSPPPIPAALKGHLIQWGSLQGTLAYGN